MKVRAALAALAAAFALPAAARTTLLNVSHDVTREFDKDYNDIDILHERANLIPADWQKRLPDNSAPYTSTTVFLVRKGNPKGIKDWDDLVKPGIGVIIPNPKTSGNGRYSYLAAWGYAVKKGGNDVQAREFVTKFLRNVPVLDAGGRGATTTFSQRGIGDVLLTFENEVFLLVKELGDTSVEVVYPSVSILAENPVSIVDSAVEKKGTRAVTRATHFADGGELDRIFAAAGKK